MNKISTLVMFFAVLSIPMSFGLQEAFAGTSPDATPLATVTINPTCGTTAAGTLNYPALDVGATTSNADEREILITNTGNRAVDVIVGATVWTNTIATFQTVMLASATHFSTVDNTGYGAQTVMALSPATVNVVSGLAAAGTTTMFHKVSIVLVTGQEAFQLSAEQTETIAFNCP